MHKLIRLKAQSKQLVHAPTHNNHQDKSKFKAVNHLILPDGDVVSCEKVDSVEEEERFLRRSTTTQSYIP